MLDVRGPVFLAFYVAASCVIVARLASAASAANNPCTLSYFDLWKDADLIFTSRVRSLAQRNRTCRVEIDKILKLSILKSEQFSVKNQSNLYSLDARNELQCDGRFRIGQTRVVFAAVEAWTGVRVLRVPRLSSWLLVLLESINAEGEILYLFFNNT